MRDYLGYKSTLDRLTYVIVEHRPVLMEFRGKIPKAFTKLGYMCMAIKARAIRIHLKIKAVNKLGYMCMAVKAWSFLPKCISCKSS